MKSIDVFYAIFIGKDKLTMNDNEINIEDILKNSAGNLYWKDLNGRYIGANNSCIELMLAHTSNFVGKTDREIYSSVMGSEEIKIIEQIDQEIIKTGKEKSDEEEGIDVHGKPAFYITRKMPLRNSHGNIIGVMGTSIDITARKQMEQDLRQAKTMAETATAKAEFEEEMRKTVMVLVGDIVHDLRTPIATIRTVATILEPIFSVLLEVIQEAKKLGAEKISLLSKKKLAYLQDNTPIESLNSAVSTMDDFINTTLIELANAQKAGYGSLTHDDLIKCSSRRILENTLDAYSIPHNIKVHLNIAYDFFLMGNSIVIMKILFNLIKNAIEQITLNGKGDITITTKDAGDKNLLIIKDTGGGAPPEVIVNLFKSYFTTKKNGTGIGLSYCKKTMEYFDGTLTCNSIYGEYMEFTLSFPKIDNN